MYILKKPKKVQKVHFNYELPQDASVDVTVLAAAA